MKNYIFWAATIGSSTSPMFPSLWNEILQHTKSSTESPTASQPSSSGESRFDIERSSDLMREDSWQFSRHSVIDNDLLDQQFSSNQGWLVFQSPKEISGHVFRGPLSITPSSGLVLNTSEPSTCSPSLSPNFLDFECDPGLALLLPLVSECSEDLPNPPPTSPWNCDFLTHMVQLQNYRSSWLIHCHKIPHVSALTLVNIGCTSRGGRGIKAPYNSALTLMYHWYMADFYGSYTGMMTTKSR